MNSDSRYSPQYDLNEENIQRLKDKYSHEMKDDVNNPIKICIKLIFEAATEKNQIRRLELSKSLSKFLTGPNGVINLFLALVDFDTSSQKVTTHNQRFIAVANIITCLPELCMPYSDYSQIIFDQLKPLLLSDNKQYSTLASIIVKSILDSSQAQSDITEKIIIYPIINSFLLPDCEIKPHEAIIIIHNLLQNHVSTNLFVEIFPNLFYALQLLETTPSRLKSLLKISIVNILNGLKAGAACCLLDKTLFHCGHLDQKYALSLEEQEISVRLADKESTSQQEFSCILKNLVISILEDSDNELLVLEFFFHFKEVMLFAREANERQFSTTLVETLLQRSVEEEPGKLDLMNIVAANGKRSLELISRTLLNCVSFFRSKQDCSAFKVMSQSVCSCCSILEVLSVTLTSIEEEELIGNKCLPVLKQLSKLLTSPVDSHQQCGELLQTIDSLTKRLESHQKNGPSEDSMGADNKFMKKEFDSITKDLNDKLVPVRVHAMVCLRQMMIANQRYAIDQIPQLYRLTLCFLGDAEPYVFLACINLMAEMAIRRTDTILPKLRELYLDGSLDLSTRLNIGEVLVRLFKQLNETAPHYAQQVMNVLFAGCQDREELVRMSSLTNIGELCRNLGESLGKYAIEIMSVLEGVFNTDTLEVKCAALDLVRSLLSGLHAINIESVQRDLISIYQLLKRVSRRQVDPKFRLHLELALDEVGRLATEILKGEGSNDNGDNLVKNIKLLSILPDK